MEFCILYHFVYNFRGEKLEGLGEKLGSLGGKFPPFPPLRIEDRTLRYLYFLSKKNRTMKHAFVRIMVNLWSHNLADIDNYMKFTVPIYYSSQD